MLFTIALLTNDLTFLLKVSIDFEVNFPTANQDFPRRFRESATKLITVLQKTIKNDFVKGLINNVDGLTENSKASVIIVALHSFLYTHKSIGGKGFKRPGMLDTVNFMMLRTSRPNIQLVIDEKREEMQKLGLTLQPFVIIRGPTYTDITDDIVLVVDTHKYLFKSLLAALAALIKFYELFDLEWPAANSAVFTFIESYFFDINRDIMSTKVDQLIQQLYEDK